MRKNLPNLRTFIVFPFVVLDTVFFAMLAILSSYTKKAGPRIDFCAITWSRILGRLAGMKVTKIYDDKIDVNRTYVMVSNHQSHLDTTALYISSPVPIRMLAKAELFKIPIFGRSLYKGGYIKISRGKDKKTDFGKLMKSVEKLKNANQTVMVFAEGTRNQKGGLQPFKSGAFIIAKKFGLPILPVTIIGTSKVLPAKTLTLIPGKVQVTFHEPIEIEDLEVEELQEKTHQVVGSIL